MMIALRYGVLLVSSAAEDLPRQVIPWLLVLLGFVLVAAFFIFLARRYSRDEGGSAAVGFTLHDLRQLHAAGELSDEEFERAKDAMIARLNPPEAERGEQTDADDPGADDSDDADRGSDRPIEP